MFEHIWTGGASMEDLHRIPAHFGLLVSRVKHYWSFGCNGIGICQRSQAVFPSNIEK